MKCLFETIMNPWVSKDSIERESSYEKDSWQYAQVKKNAVYQDEEVVNRSKINNKTCFIQINTKTGNCYQTEHSSLIAFKCGLLAIGMPFYTVGRTLFSLVRIIGDIVHTIITEFGKFKKHYYEQRSIGYCISTFFAAVCVKTGMLFASNLLQAGRVFYKGIGMQLAAIYGCLVDPYKGRQYISILEREINSRPRHYAICYGITKPNRVFYLAFCMQPVGKINDTLDNHPEVKRFEIIKTYENKEQLIEDVENSKNPQGHAAIEQAEDECFFLPFARVAYSLVT